jgi:hypothetical protein
MGKHLFGSHRREGGVKPFMRHGAIISAVGHVAAIVLAVLFTGANPFDSVATEAIAVDIISPSEVPPDPPQADAPETPPQPQVSPPQFDPLFELALTPQPSPPLPSTATKPVQPAAQQRARDQQSGGAAASPSGAPGASRASGAAAKPPAPPDGPPVQPPPPAAQEAGKDATAAAAPGTRQSTNVADLFGMPLTLPDGRLGGGFDAPAIEATKIERSSVDAFRAHLKTCAALPAGIAPSEKISLVVHVSLNADGTLAGPPTLMEASASPKGPILLQSLLRGLRNCQPYNMLPTDKYREWKSLDIRFTPDDMGQG